MGISDQQFSDESESDPYDSDDTQEDPSFDVLEETQLTFSNLSIKKKTQSRILKVANEKNGEDLEVITMFVPELDEKDPKSYEIIQKIVEGGQMQKLKVDHCKMYLRKHGLRLSGNKDTLIQRIREHIDIVNDGGEKRYPASSFVLNCKGDACTGDVVMFEQNVYEVFGIALWSGNGPPRGTRVIAPPCGTRVIAGRIVKESYGAAKQQHTFTIEVLWSKGEKPLPPLHPLLIKGRNLYRLKTMRQKWEDEGKRQKILSEKHARGGAARFNKNARIQKTELQKAETLNRVTRNELQNKNQEAEKGKPTEIDCEPKIHCYTKTNKLDVPIQPENLHGKPNSISNAQLQAEKPYPRQPLIGLNSSFPRGPHTSSQYSSFDASKSPGRSDFHDKQHKNYATATSSIPGPLQWHNGEENWRHNHMRNPLHGQTHMNYNISSYSQQNHAYNRQRNFMAARHPSAQGKGHEQKQLCKYYAQGRCHYGERCKYLHQ